MTAELRRGLFLAILGLVLGLGSVAALFGGADLKRAVMSAVSPDAPSVEAGRSAVGALSPDAGRPADKPEPGRQAAVAPPAPVPQPAAADPNAPTFDVVRVEPNGEAVVAGRAAPNAVVELLVDGRAVARARADPNGQFALVPPALPVGNSEIVLRQTGADGRETRSKDSVAVAVSTSREARPLVALTAPDRPTVVLSQPEPRAAQGQPKPGAPDKAASKAGSASPAPPTIVSVDAQEGGRLFVTGQAPPGASVRLYLNDTPIAPARVGADGKVTFTIGRGVRPGAYRVRIDQVDPVSGKVRSRAEVPFTVPEPARVAAGDKPAAPANPQRPATAPEAAPGTRTPAAFEPPKAAGAPAGSAFVPEINTAKIIRGDSLWEISRRTYGTGDRYTVIYDANQQQIRNPELIYPGQLFVLPGEGAKAGGKDGKRG